MFIQIITRTPLWVWGLFLVLIYFGIQQTKTRELPKRRIAILPIIMISLSLAGILSTFGANWIGLAGWLMAAALVVVISQQIKSNGNITFSPATQKFSVPGSWLPLGLMMTIFFTKFIVSVSLSIRPEFSKMTVFIFASSFIYGWLSSIFLVRSWRVWATQNNTAALKNNI
jgi:hypothetical protein